MIVTVTPGCDIAGTFSYLSVVQGLLDYLGPAPGQHDRLHDVQVLNAGLDDAEALSGQQLATVVAAMKAVAASRRDMKYVVLHLMVSPDPRRALLVGPRQMRKECEYVLDRVLVELGLADRIGIRGYHRDGHSEWAGAPDDALIEHPHHVSLIPHPETLKGIPLHGFKRRAQRASAEAERDLGLTPAPTRRPPSTLPSAPRILRSTRCEISRG